MADAVITAGSEFIGSMPGLGLTAFTYQVTTAANGEDGVDINIPCDKVVSVQLTCAEADMIAVSPAYSISGTKITVYVTAGATGDAALVDVLVLGI